MSSPPLRHRARACLPLLLATTLAAAFGLVACGDTSLYISFRSGTVDSDPSCGGRGGSFDFRETNGLVVLVVFASDDAVVTSGGTEVGCSALRRGDAVEVSGSDEGNRIEADEIVIR